MEEPTQQGRNQRKVLTCPRHCSPTMSPGRKEPPFSFFLQSFRSGHVGWFVSSSYTTQFSVFVRDHVGRKVACLPSHPLEKLVARKKRRGSEAVYEAKLLPFRRKTDSARRYFDSKAIRSKKKSRISFHSRSGSFPPPSVRSSLPFSKMTDWSAQQRYKVDCSLADPLLPIRVGLTQKYSKKEWNHWRVVCSSHLGKDD
ncbi:UNVERIFIED_CONTAM: hypothetical protein Sangu_2842900 [Sesamum angustifolium]|uniref:Uncharacterized protein n=1 Tax=Sesamum angustifolium TaxID=2727405 RepID=A0AAW2IR74_9LAMI